MGDAKVLEQTFSVFDPITHKFLTKGLLYDEEHTRLYLPSG